MATSPLFGWQEPNDSDLVKDGAAAIRTLGNAIDTSMGDLLGGTTGQRLVKQSNTNMDFTWETNPDIQKATLTTTGDVLYASAASTPARLGIGSTNQVLTVSGGLPVWAATQAFPYTWSTYTPTLSQGGTVTATTNWAMYITQGKMTTLLFKMTVTGTGTGGSSVTISLPSSLEDTAYSGTQSGSMKLYDSSAALKYQGFPETNGTGVMIFQSTSTNVATLGATGSTFTAGLAVNDFITGAITFRSL